MILYYVIYIYIYIHTCVYVCDIYTSALSLAKSSSSFKISVWPCGGKAAIRLWTLRAVSGDLKERKGCTARGGIAKVQKSSCSESRCRRGVLGGVTFELLPRPLLLMSPNWTLRKESVLYLKQEHTKYKTMYIYIYIHTYMCIYI